MEDDMAASWSLPTFPIIQGQEYIVMLICKSIYTRKLVGNPSLGQLVEGHLGLGLLKVVLTGIRGLQENIVEYSTVD